nr:hypothetical protein [Desulfobacula sp.]
MAGSFIYALFYLFECKAPHVEASLPSGYLKKGYELPIALSDKKTGLRHVMVKLSQQGRETVLADKKYDSPGLLGIFSGSKTLNDSLLVPIEPLKYGITDGEVNVSVIVSDNSLWGWGKGNITRIEETLVFDSKPPVLTLLSEAHNVERGGSGLILYKLHEENIKSGVRVGDLFFPGHPGLFKNKDIHACLFALDYLQGPGTKIWLTAEDKAGNVTEKKFPHYIRDKAYPTDTLEISETFLERKMPEFDLGEKEGVFQGEENPLLKNFYTSTGI